MCVQFAGAVLTTVRLGLSGLPPPLPKAQSPLFAGLVSPTAPTTSAQFLILVPGLKMTSAPTVTLAPGASGPGKRQVQSPATPPGGCAASQLPPHTGPLNWPPITPSATTISPS